MTTATIMIGIQWYSLVRIELQSRKFKS